MEISRLNETKRPDVAILCKILKTRTSFVLFRIPVKGRRIVLDGLKSQHMLEGKANPRKPLSFLNIQLRNISFEDTGSLDLLLHCHGLPDGPDWVLCRGEKLHREDRGTEEFEWVHVKQYRSANGHQVYSYEYYVPWSISLLIENYPTKWTQSWPLLLWQQAPHRSNGRH